MKVQVLHAATRFVRIMLFCLAPLTFAAPALSQSIGDYAYVHKMLVNLERPPWRCVCYSVSRSSLIDTHSADNQVWVVSRHNSWAGAVEQRDMLRLGSNNCSFCPGASDKKRKPNQWFVFENCNSGRCEIGVADSSYSATGWRRVSSAFGDDREAWKLACRLHDSKRGFSPDIARGKVRCKRPAGGSGGGGMAGYRKIPGAFINGHGIGVAEKGHTEQSCARRCSAEPRCRSFEVTGTWCSINAVDARGKPDMLTRSPKYSYFERIDRTR